MEELLQEIVAREWEMFHNTQSVGGPAWCQNEPEQFAIQRRSQFLGWDEATLRAWLEDLKAAEAAGRNLFAYKYAYMMESTDPAGFAALKDKLPPIDEEKRALVEELVKQTLTWCEAFQAKYPHIAERGRPLRSSSDSPCDTSVETYARGELSTYGTETLRLLRERFCALAAEGRNIHEETVALEFNQQGFDDLGRVEEWLESRK